MHVLQVNIQQLLNKCIRMNSLPFNSYTPSFTCYILAIVSNLYVCIKLSLLLLQLASYMTIGKNFCQFIKCHQQLIPASYIGTQKDSYRDIYAGYRYWVQPCVYFVCSHWPSFLILGYSIICNYSYSYIAIYSQLFNLLNLQQLSYNIF